MRREEKSAGLCPKELLSEIERLKAENFSQVEANLENP